MRFKILDYSPCSLLLSMMSICLLNNSNIGCSLVGWQCHKYEDGYWSDGPPGNSEPKSGRTKESSSTSSWSVMSWLTRRMNGWGFSPKHGSKSTNTTKMPRSERISEVKTKKLKASVQQLGLSQDIIWSDHSVIANPSNTVLHCQFCNRDHRFASFPRRRTLGPMLAGHQLTIKNPSNTIALIDRLKTCMPVVSAMVHKKCYGKIEKKMLSMNLVLHSAYNVMGVWTGQIKSS